MIRGDDGRYRLPPMWIPDFPANIYALDDLIHNTGWKWLKKWWYRRSWSRIYPLPDDIWTNRLGHQIVYELLKDGPMDYRRFTALLFLCQKRMMEETGMEPRLPFLWGWPTGPVPGAFVIG